TSSPDLYTLSLHDALPISPGHTDADAGGLEPHLLLVLLHGPPRGATKEPVRQGIGAQHVGAHGLAKVREIEAPEDAVPVRAVALGSVHFLPGVLVWVLSEARVPRLLDPRAQLRDAPVKSAGFRVAGQAF